MLLDRYSSIQSIYFVVLMNINLDFFLPLNDEYQSYKMNI
jgi:hypothetical protein